MKKNQKLYSVKKIILFFCFLMCFRYTEISSLEKLRISSIPDESITELHKKFLPLKEYLEKKLNLQIKFVPVSDYASVVEALSTNKIDLAWLGGFTFVQSYKRSDGQVEPIIQRVKDEKFTSVFIVNKKDKIKSFKDLNGKSFSFGSPSSTSGHIMPRYFLLKQNIIPESFFSPVAYSGAHDATLYSVLSGKVKAGVLNSLVWHKLIKQKPQLKEKLKVLFETEHYYDYNWTIRKQIPQSIKDQIVKAFLELNINNLKHKEILELQRAEKYIKTNKENYDIIHEAAKSANIIN